MRDPDMCQLARHGRRCLTESLPALRTHDNGSVREDVSWSDHICEHEHNSHIGINPSCCHVLSYTHKCPHVHLHSLHTPGKGVHLVEESKIGNHCLKVRVRPLKTEIRRDFIIGGSVSALKTAINRLKDLATRTLGVKVTLTSTEAAT